MKSLTEIFAEIGNNTGVDIGCNDKGGIHTYLETYDRLFAPFRNGCTMMEVGLAMGDSLKLWDEYFEKSDIYGIDISVVFEKPVYKNRVTIIESDITKEVHVPGKNYVTYDIIIDDGSHLEADQINTFNVMKHRVRPGGIYIIEDILALDQNRHRFEALHDNCEIIDMRHTGRFDNVLILFRF